MEICPRCQEPRPNVGPWNGPIGAQYKRLCGHCKATVVLEDPESRRRLEADLKRAFGALLVVGAR